MTARQRLRKDGRRVGNRHKVCDACRYAIAVHHMHYRTRRILNGAKANKGTGYKLSGGTLYHDATGTRRRLQALGVMGWGWEQLGKRLGGINGNNLGTIARGQKTRLYPETVAKIKAIYDELSMLPPPDTRGVKMTKTRLRRLGWVPPLAWDDEMIDDPYALPSGLSQQALWDWYCKAATPHERIEWVLEHGVPKNPKGGK